MPTHVFNPSAGDVFPANDFGVEEGGLSGSTPAENLEALQGIDRALKGQPNGPVPLTEFRTIDNQYLTNLKVGTISISGPASGRAGLTLVYQITNYSSFESYKLEYERGNGWLEEDHIFFTLPDEAGPCTFSVNGRSITVMVNEGSPSRPTIVYPVDDFHPVSLSLVVEGSPFIISDDGPYIETFVAADCEISKFADFSELYVAKYRNLSTTFNIQEPIPEEAVYIRIRYHSTERTSDWSPAVRINGVSRAIKTPTVLSPTVDQQIGVPNPDDPARGNVRITVQVSAFDPQLGDDVFVSSDIEVATDIEFNNIVSSSYDYTLSDQNLQLSGLGYGVVQYVRVRHNGNTKVSQWSVPVRFLTAVDQRTIAKPSHISYTLDSSKTSLTYLANYTDFLPVGYTDALVRAEYQLSLTPDFTTPVLSDVSTAEPVIVTGINFSTQYYLRVRYVGGVKTSPWSDPVLLTTASDDRVVKTPTIVSPENNQAGVSTTPTITASLFATESSLMNYQDTHQSSDWELSTVANFTSLVASLYNTVTSKQSWLPGSITYSAGYYVRTRQRGVLKVSDWSVPTFFTALASTVGAFELVGAGGGGGGGGGRNNGDTYGNGGGGGGAGYRLTGNLTIVPGQTYQVVVGKGGDKGLGGGVGATGTAGQVGGQSKIDTNTANGGQPGTPGGKGIYTKYPGTGSIVNPGQPMWIIVQEGTVGQGGAGSVPGQNGTAAGDNNSVPGVGGNGGDSPYGGDGGRGGNGGYTGQDGVDGQNGKVVLEYSSLLPLLVTTGASYALVNGKHQYTWSVPGTYQFILQSTGYIAEPTVSILNGVQNTPAQPVIEGSAFAPVNYQDTHVSTDWQIASDPGFTTLVAVSNANTVNKLSWSPNIPLTYGATYYARARYNGSIKSSGYSAAKQFTTMADPTPVINTPGAPVAVFMVANRFDFVPPELPTAANLAIDGNLVEVDFEVYHSRNGRTATGRFRYNYGSGVGTQQPVISTSVGLTYQSDITYTTASQIFSDLGWAMRPVPSNKGYKINILNTFISDWWTGGGDTYIRVRFIQGGVTSPWSPYSNAVVQGGY